MKNRNKIIFIAGHKGMVGSAILKTLKKNDYKNIVTVDKSTLDLTNQNETHRFFENNKIEVVVNAAAKVGGILANDSFPYDFIMKNMLIQNNLIQSSLDHKIEKFVFLGSSCIYPKMAPQPLREPYLLSGPLEPTNEWYAIAKISGIMACKAAKKQYGLNTISLMPTNLYGENDNFDLMSSHVLPAMIRKFHEAKIQNSDVTLWGTGSPYREFLFVDDLADAVLFAIENNLTEDIYNVGYGADISIKDLAETIQKMVGHHGNIIWDDTKPDGTPKKLMDSSKLNQLGWNSKTSLEKGIEKTYQWYLKNNL